MKINVHAGHNPDGKIACGAVGLIKESTEARKVKKEVIKLLRKKVMPYMTAPARMGQARRMS